MMSIKGEENGAPVGNSGDVESAVKRVTDVDDLRQQLCFLWRWISRLNGDKPHDTPEKQWREYVSVMVHYPSSPYNTGDWFEDYLPPRVTRLTAKESSPPQIKGDTTPTVS